jgi:hypothetical protein
MLIMVRLPEAEGDSLMRKNLLAVAAGLAMLIVGVFFAGRADAMLLSAPAGLSTAIAATTITEDAAYVCRHHYHHRHCWWISHRHWHRYYGWYRPYYAWYGPSYGWYRPYWHRWGWWGRPWYGYGWGWHRWWF